MHTIIVSIPVDRSILALSTQSGFRVPHGHRYKKTARCLCDEWLAEWDLDSELHSRFQLVAQLGSDNRGYTCSKRYHRSVRLSRSTVCESSLLRRWMLLHQRCVSRQPIIGWYLMLLERGGAAAAEAGHG